MLTTILLRTVRKVSKYVVMMGNQRESGVTTRILQGWDVRCARDTYFVRRRGFLFYQAAFIWQRAMLEL